MKEFSGHLSETIERTQTIKSFRFVADKKISFIPGQFLQVRFDQENKDNRQLNKYLSFSSSPHQAYFEVTKRLSSSEFSQRLNSFKKNDLGSFTGPLGNCIFKDEYKKICFLIGGIGITPVMSILGYIAEQNLTTDVVLVYSNKTPQEIAFKTELDNFKSAKNNINIIYTLTDYQPVDPGCYYGRIDTPLLDNKLKDIKERLIFIFGPPKMVEAMRDLCLASGCAKENLRAESFIGY